MQRSESKLHLRLPHLFFVILATFFSRVAAARVGFQSVSSPFGIVPSFVFSAGQWSSKTQLGLFSHPSINFLRVLFQHTNIIRSRLGNFRWKVPLSFPHRRSWQSAHRKHQKKIMAHQIDQGLHLFHKHATRVSPGEDVLIMDLGYTPWAVQAS